MALTEQEKQTIKKLKAEGYSLTEIQGHISGKRLNRPGSIESQQAEEFIARQPSFLQKAKEGVVNTVRDIPSDFREGFQNSVNSVSDAMQTSQDVRQRVETGETTPASGTLQTMGAGLGAGAEVVGNAVLVAGKTFIPEQVEQAISQVVGSGAEAVVKSRPAQEVQDMYEGLSEEKKRNVQATLEAAEGLTTAFGFGPVVNKLGRSMSSTAKSALQKSDEILQRSRQTSYTPVATAIPDTKGVRKTIKDLRFNLSEVDPQVETVLKRSNFDEVNRYFQQARLAKADSAKDTPLSLAADKAETAYNAIDEARRNAVKGKMAILDRVATERVPGNTINEVMSSGIQRIKARFGANVSSNGGITQTGGRVMKLDSSDQKLVSEYMSRLNSLGISPTVQEVDDFIDWAQGQLYKQSKTVSKFEVASEPVVKELQSITGDLNGRLKQVVGGGYGDVNARVSRLIELQDELSRSLGADNRKGAGVMKRLFSPTGDETRRIFGEIQKETGIDLAKEATLAKFAMESVGDVRQKSLLQELDANVGIAEQFQLTNPVSWYRTIREFSDLDGQDLANEILRRQQR